MKGNFRRTLHSRYKVIDSEWPEDHPGRKFIIRFHEVQDLVCGRDIAWPGRPRIQQEWQSRLLSRTFSFSSFAYSFLNVTITMEEWFDEPFARSLSPSELHWAALFEFKMALLTECDHAAAIDGNEEIRRFVREVRVVLEMYMHAIAHRVGRTTSNIIDEHGKSAELGARLFLRKSL